MKLTDVLTDDLVKMDLEATSREGAIRELVQLFADRGRIRPEDVEPLSDAILQREQLGSTAIGRGVAIPHAKAPAAREFIAAFGRSAGGVAFASIDGEPVHLIFLLASPPDSQRAHLKALAHISRLLTKQDLRARILEAKDPKEALSIFAEEENSR
jgi:fructose-specific phosphotransferase system IIA component